MATGLNREDKWERNEDAALDFLYRFMRTDDNDDVDREKARIAAATLSSATRRQATSNAREALYFGMARSMTDDPDKLAEYIRVTSPSAPIVKALPGPTDITPNGDDLNAPVNS